MTLSAADIDRIGAASETIERSLSVLADKQSLSREAYRNDRETRDVVERRFVNRFLLLFDERFQSVESGRNIRVSHRVCARRRTATHLIVIPARVNLAVAILNCGVAGTGWLFVNGGFKYS